MIMLTVYAVHREGEAGEELEHLSTRRQRAQDARVTFVATLDQATRLPLPHVVSLTFLCDVCGGNQGPGTVEARLRVQPTEPGTHLMDMPPLPDGWRLSRGWHLCSRVHDNEAILPR